MAPLVLVTGFSSFEEIDRNPSAEVALGLEEEPPEGVEVRSGVLPVSFERAPRALDELLASLEPRIPDLFLGLGVDSKGSGYRLEVRARGRLFATDRTDVDGMVAAEASASTVEELRTGLDVVELRDGLAAERPGGLRVSDDAGGYVCEHVYHHLLSRAAAVGRPCLFVHVPPIESEPVESQLRFVSSVVQALVAVALT